MATKTYRPQAVALGYDPSNDRAPKVLARGGGETATRIMAAAKEHNIPLYQDPALASVLIHQDIGSEVPIELYDVVAEILAYIYHLKARRTIGGSEPIHD